MGKYFGHSSEHEMPIQYGHAEKFRRAAVYPAKYSLKDLGFVPDVRDQFTDNCWIYAAIGVAEIFIRKHKLPTGSTLYDDLSEMHMTYDSFDIDKNSTDNKNPEGMLPEVDTSTGAQSYGGDKMDACAYFTRGSGCVGEDADPAYENLSGNMTPRRFAVTDGKERRFLVTGIHYLEDPVGARPDMDFIEDVKDALMTDGAVCIAILYEKKNMKKDSSTKPYKKSYYCNKPNSGTNHEVCVVGWDDGYSKSNFALTPPVDGAFLIRNSWGETKDSSGTVLDDGYFWLSYADTRIRNAYSLTGMRADYYEQANRCYRNNIFSMHNKSDELGDDSQMEFSARYAGAAAGSALTDVGVCCLTPCLATITCEIGGTVHTLATDYKLPYAGYHTIHLASPLTLGTGAWEVSVTYNSIHHIRVFAPVEYKYDVYENIKLASNQSFVDGEDVVDINKRKGEKYGNVIIQAFVHVASPDAVKLEAAYKSAASKLPAQKDGRIDGLPDKIDNIATNWRIEPFEVKSYLSSYNPTIAEYTVGSSSKGLINLTAGAASGYVCAALGAAPMIMRKNVAVTLGVKGSYMFNAPKATKGECTTTLSGDFPVDGAKITATARGKSKTTTVKNKKWEIKNFELFHVDARKKEGWKDEYKETPVTVTITGDSGVSLASGTAEAKADCPYEKASTGEYIVETFLGLLCALLAIGVTYAVVKCRKSIKLAEDAEPLLANAMLLADLGADGRVSISNIKTNSFMEEIYGAENIDFVMASTSSSSNKEGCIARKIRKGGRITNCTVTGTVAAGSDQGGLFYEGEDVTVTGCTVNVTTNEVPGTFAGVGVKLSGECKISSVAVNGTVKAEKACGIAGEMDGGTIAACAVNLNLRGETLAAGVVGEAKDAAITNCCVSGSLSASGSSSPAGGIAAMLSGDSSVTNCRVYAEISAGNSACGIAAKMSGNASVSRCYAACKLTAPTACGIAEGISGKASAVQKCASLCSHIAGAHPARVAINGSEGCIAYKDMTCDAGVSFAADSGAALKAPDELLEKSTFEAIGWDFTLVWAMHEKDSYPYLILNTGARQYDYPFPRPYTPQNGFTFPVGQMICFYGNSHPRASAPTWTLSPVDGKTELKSGECLCKDGSFYLEIGTMAHAGDYKLSVISPLDGHKYTMPLIIKIT